MRLGWFRPVHCKSVSAQETRSLLPSCKLVQKKLRDVENSLRGILRGFGLKVGKTTGQKFAGRIEELVAGHPHLQVITKALLAVRSGAADRVLRLREADPQDGAVRHAGAAADVDPGGRPDRGADLCQRDRRSNPVQIIEAGRSPFRVNSQEASIRRDRLHRPDQQDRYPSVRTALYEAANVMLTKPVKGCSQLKSWAMRIAKRAGRAKPRWRWRAGSR